MLRRFGTNYANDAIAAFITSATAFPPKFPPLGDTNGAGYNCIWVGLSYTYPDQDGNDFNEPSISASGVNGYARQPLITSPSNKAQWTCLYGGSAVHGLYVNTSGVQFPNPSGTWSTSPSLPMVAVGYFDQASGGNLLAVDATIPPVFAFAGTPAPYFPPGSLVYGINSGWERRGLMSEWLANQVSAYMLTAGSLSTPDFYLALCTKVPLPSDTGSTISEVASSNGYVRFHAGNNNWTPVKKGRYGNAIFWGFALPTGTWNNCPAWAALDASSAGHLLFGGLLDPPRLFDAWNPAYFGVKSVQVGVGK